MLFKIKVVLVITGCRKKKWNVSFLVWYAGAAIFSCLLVVFSRLLVVCGHLLVVWSHLLVVCGCLLVVCGRLSSSTELLIRLPKFNLKNSKSFRRNRQYLYWISTKWIHRESNIPTFTLYVHYGWPLDIDWQRSPIIQHCLSLVDMYFPQE